MAKLQSAKKQLRQNERRRIRNRSLLSELKTLMKRVRTEKDSSRGANLLQEAYSTLDKAAQSKIIHPKKASRHKSQVSKMVGQLKAVVK